MKATYSRPIFRETKYPSSICRLPVASGIVFLFEVIQLGTGGLRSQDRVIYLTINVFVCIDIMFILISVGYILAKSIFGFDLCVRYSLRTSAVQRA